MSTLPINFSAGALFMVRNDSSIVDPTPVKIGVLQEGSVEFSGQLKELFGTYQFPFDVARGPIKVMGKAKSAQIFSVYYDLFFGLGVTGSTGLAVTLNEAATLAATAYTVTNHATFTQDLGVSYSSTGIPLQRTASGTLVQGYYSYNGSGVYQVTTFDEVALLFSYENSVTSTNEIPISNQLMGSQPTFLCVLNTTYKGNVFNIHLNQCVAEKLAFPFKNTDYSIMELDFECYADAANNIGKITFTDQWFGMDDPVIKIAGRDYPVPLLTVRQLRIVVPAIMRVGKLAADPTAITTAIYDDMLAIIFWGAVWPKEKSAKDVTVGIMMDWHITFPELQEAMRVIRLQTGMFVAQAEGAPVGEAKTADPSNGTSSSPNSATG